MVTCLSLHFYYQKDGVLWKVAGKEPIVKVTFQVQGFCHGFKNICDTLRIQVFLRFSGELVSFQELGQSDLINLL